MKEPIEIAQNVRTALGRGAPVVALESTVIAHGLPDKTGIEAAAAMAKEIDSEGCTPAVIGIIEGKIKVGLSDEEIKRLAESEDVMKLSTREIAEAIVAKKDGATTVAATMSIANSTGIPVVATGGIGGVHRGANESWDISADLWELAKTPSLVVCSGAKSVLDLPATLEWLETHQVPVYGFGTDELPAFYSRKSGLKVKKLDSPKDVSEMYLARLSLGQRSAMVLAVPIPEKDEVDLSDEIEQAIAAAKEQKIAGSELTPWLLSHIQQLSGGKAVSANLSLLANNAKVAAQVAAVMLGERDVKRIGYR